MPTSSDLWRRLRHGHRLQPVRRHLPAATAAAGALAGARGRSRLGGALLALAAAGFAEQYRRGRRRGLAELEEHHARMRRLRPSVLRHFYVTCIGSMEAELEEYPTYDRRKHEQRYRRLARTALPYTPQGGTVLDVGCASGLVLDSIRAVRGTRGIGFDLAPYGLHQRAARPDAPILAQAVCEQIPLRDDVVDVVVFSEVIEHLIDAYQGLREVSRVMRTGGVLVLTTNNASEMPVVSPLVDPGQWLERLLGRWWPRLLAFRNITWYAPINREVDPLPAEAPTYAPHFHFAFSELRDLAADAGFELLSQGSFEFPAPQSPLADRLRRLSARTPWLGNLLSDAVEYGVAAIPGLNLMGTHHELVFRKVGPPRNEPRTPWWPARLVPAEGDAADRRRAAA